MKRRKILTVLATLILAFLVIGFSYAFYSARITETNKTKTVIRVGKGLNLIFTGTAEVEAQKLVPGDKRTKTFTVENEYDEDIVYNIYIENVTNKFNEDLVYTLKKGNETVVEETRLPETSEGKSYLLTSIEIAGKTIDSYTLEIEYKYLADKSQDDYQGAIFKGTVGIDTEQIDGSVNCAGMSLKDCVMALSEVDESIVKQIQPSTTQTGDKATIDYRYIGANPDNYVCLEENGECTEDQLYRIIGVIPTQKEVNGDFENRVKLIKSTNYVGPTAEDVKSYGTSSGQLSATPEGKGYYWSGNKSNSSNDWTASTLNTDILNSTTNQNSYWNSISAYHKYIDDAVWYLGAQDENEETPQNFYESERGEERGSADGPNNYNTKAKIGLMYASDYGYATSGGSEEQRNTCISSVQWDWNISSHDYCFKNDWLLDGYYQWTLTSDSSATNHVAIKNNHAWSIYTTGYLYNHYVHSDPFGVRPVFNLASNVKYNGGTGDHDDPYLVAL